jgi:hypothetical protein
MALYADGGEVERKDDLAVVAVGIDHQQVQLGEAMLRLDAVEGANLNLDVGDLGLDIGEALQSLQDRFRSKDDSGECGSLHA